MRIDLHLGIISIQAVLSLLISTVVVLVAILDVVTYMEEIVTLTWLRAVIYHS